MMDARPLKKNSKLNLSLVAFIVLPLIVATAGMSWSTSQMLDTITSNVNKQDEIRSLQTANSAVYSVQKKLEGTSADNAHWDEAIYQVYNTINEKWVFSAWGVATRDSNYDAMYIVDAAGKEITAYRKGEKIDMSSKSYFGAALPKLLADLPHDNTNFKVVSSLVQTPFGVAAVAVAPILPYSKELAIPSDRPRYFVIVQDFDEKLVGELGGAFILNKLKVSPIESEQHDGHALMDNWGLPVATVDWESSNPGKATRDSSFNAVLTAVLSLLVMMIPLALVHLFTLKKMEENERDAFQSARRDSLSGLPNRLHLIEATNKKLPLANAKNNELALAFIDLDGFKSVNDSYGHDIGDALIKVVASGLSEIAEGKAVIARLGGDEFALFVSGARASEKAQALADEVLHFVKEPFDISGRIVSIGASIGIARCATANLCLSEFMRRADIAMYDAKENGRNRWHLFNPNLDIERSEDLEIVTELRRYIDHQLLEVAYQPIVSSRDRKIVGVEALARWPASSSRKIGPERFVKLAEQYGLIDSLGLSILRKACSEMSRWKDLKLSVNFSPLQIKRPNLVADIEALARETDFELGRLEVELTETVLIQDPDRTKIVINAMKALGMTVALDDFGTGFASVGYLNQFAFDRIKLDRSLTQSLSRGDMTHNIVQGTVLIAKGLSADVIAEGVETEEEANLMRLAGCELLQGYYFGKPQNAAVLNDILTARDLTSKAVSA